LHCLIFPLFHVLWPALVKWLQRQIVFLLIFKMNPTRGCHFNQLPNVLAHWILPMFDPQNTQHNAITTMHIAWPSSSTLFQSKWGAGCTWDLNHTSLVPKYSLATTEPCTSASYDLTFSQLALTAVSCRCMCFIVNFK
jgi:hypothetical protein